MEINLLDSEILEAEKVLKAIGEKSGKSVDLEGFRKEIVGRFQEIGLIVDPKVWSTDADDVFAFDIEITGRTAPKPFDYDRQVWEVTRDILELLPPQDRGVLKSGKVETPAPHKH